MKRSPINKYHTGKVGIGIDPTGVFTDLSDFRLAFSAVADATPIHKSATLTATFNPLANTALSLYPVEAGLIIPAIAFNNTTDPNSDGFGLFKGRVTNAGTGAWNKLVMSDHSYVGNSTGTMTGLAGFSSLVTLSGSHNVTTLTHLLTNSTVAGGAAIGTEYGLRVQTMTATGTAAGVWIDNVSSATSSYALYTNAGAVRLGDHLSLANTGTASELRLFEPSAGGSSYTGFKAGALSANIIYRLPLADGSSGDKLTTNGAGLLSWAAAGSINGAGTATQIGYFTDANTITSDAGLTWDGTTLLAGNLASSANNTHDIATSLVRYKDQFLAGNLYLGIDTDTAKISFDTASDALWLNPGNVGVTPFVLHASQGLTQVASNADYFNQRVILWVQTADDTVTELTTDGGAVVAGNSLVLTDHTTWVFSIYIAARRNGSDNESAGYKLEGCIDRAVGEATTALVGVVVTSVISEDNLAWDVSATANTTLGSLEVKVTGEAAKDIKWAAMCDITKVIATGGLE